MNPKALHAAGSRALEVIEADRNKVDTAEDAQLRDEEEAARAKTRCTLHDNGDGTMRITATVPTLAGAILKKILDQCPHHDADASAPPTRRSARSATPAPRGSSGTAAAAKHSCLIEHLPTDHLHHKVAASVIVKLDHDSLLDGLEAAGLDTGDLISAAEARRLACNAALIPAVLNKKSVLLDLGRSARFFTEGPTHRRRPDPTRPAPPTAARPPTPGVKPIIGSPGSATDAPTSRISCPLCGFHHQRIHDPAYDHRYRPDGAISFVRRT